MGATSVPRLPPLHGGATASAPMQRSEIPHGGATASAPMQRSEILHGGATASAPMQRSKILHGGATGSAPVQSDEASVRQARSCQSCQSLGRLSTTKYTNDTKAGSAFLVVCNQHMLSNERSPIMFYHVDPVEESIGGIDMILRGCRNQSQSTVAKTPSVPGSGMKTLFSIPGVP